MKVKTSELIGAALDWAVAKCEGIEVDSLGIAWVPGQDMRHFNKQFKPSIDGGQGTPLIERERIETRHDGRHSWCAWHRGYGAVFGPTLLVATMRCYVASKMGEEVEVPDELCQ